MTSTTTATPTHAERWARRASAPGPAYVPHARRPHPDDLGELDPDSLWTRQRDGDRQARDELVARTWPTLRAVARTMHHELGGRVDPDDLMSDGALGLLDAIAKYDPSRGAFESYAAWRIRWSILDEARRRGWVPRVVVSQIKVIDTASEQLGARGVEPNTQRLATATGLTTRQVEQALVHRQRGLLCSLDEPNPGADHPGDTLGAGLVDDRPGPETLAMEAADRALVGQAIGALRERTRSVVHLHYFEGWPLAAIARDLGVSESRVCQIHRAALPRIRTHLTALDWRP